MTQPSGYRGPADSGRDRELVMSDLATYAILVEIGQLHEVLCVELDKDVERAAHGAAEPASGYVTGSNDRDQMAAVAAAVKQAEAERTRRLKNARQELRRAVEWYERQLGMRPPRRPRVETIDYLNGDGQRKVG